jgi:hypothetical protein
MDFAKLIGDVEPSNFETTLATIFLTAFDKLLNP